MYLWKLDYQGIVHIALNSHSMDTQISPPYPKSWTLGLFKKAFSEDYEKSSRMRDH